MSNKEINKQEEDIGRQHKTGGQATRLRQESSQDETMKFCKVNLPIADYGQLVQLALRQGCTPEELVAQQIEHLIRKGTK